MQDEYAAFESGKTFFDNKHYPRGFGRSGDFTLKEAELLSRCGVTMQQLTLDKVAPKGKVQKQFLAVLKGERAAETTLEKVWSRYLDKTTRPVIRYSCSAAATDGEFASEDVSGEF